ncbi:hypothetical protein DFH09DRAFT_1088669 [Mycena vulgaris]|nr:hypothetical protein DFH09DRAFT_1088669 [Mycena vulgaris]
MCALVVVCATPPRKNLSAISIVSALPLSQYSSYRPTIPGGDARAAHSRMRIYTCVSGGDMISDDEGMRAEEMRKYRATMGISGSMGRIVEWQGQRKHDVKEDKMRAREQTRDSAKWMNGVGCEACEGQRRRERRHEWGGTDEIKKQRGRTQGGMRGSERGGHEHEQERQRKYATRQDARAFARAEQGNITARSRWDGDGDECSCEGAEGGGNGWARGRIEQEGEWAGGRNE